MNLMLKAVVQIEPDPTDQYYDSNFDNDQREKLADMFYWTTPEKTLNERKRKAVVRRVGEV